MSRREQIRTRRAQEQRKQNLTIVGILAIAAVLIVGILFWQDIRDAIMPQEPVVQPLAMTIDPEMIDGKNYGPEDAKVVVREFADFQCPYCGLVAASITPIIKQEFIDTGASVRLEFRHFIVVDPIASGGESRSAAEASECAVDQGKFWEFHNYVFANQDGENRGGFRDARLRQIAGSAGLDLTAYDTCMSSNSTAQRVRDNETEAQQLGLNSTPTLLINGQRVENPLDYDAVRQAIQVALAAP